MIYDSSSHGHGDGRWHCPFSPEWVKRMAHAAKHCRELTAEHIEAVIDGAIDSSRYVLSKGDFLSEEQDARGLPLSWCREYEERHQGWPTCCTVTYDYDSVPEVVITDGDDDWAVKTWAAVERA